MHSRHCCKHGGASFSPHEDTRTCLMVTFHPYKKAADTHFYAFYSVKSMAEGLCFFTFVHQFTLLGFTDRPICVVMEAPCGCLPLENQVGAGLGQSDWEGIKPYYSELSCVRKRRPLGGIQSHNPQKMQTRAFYALPVLNNNNKAKHEVVVVTGPRPSSPSAFSLPDSYDGGKGFFFFF